MPKYKFPLESQDDYKGVIYFTTLIETPPSINASAFQQIQGVNEDGSANGIFDWAVDLGDLVTSNVSAGYVSMGETVQLYLPPAIQIQDGVQFDNFGFGVRGEAARQSLTDGTGSVLGKATESLLGTGTIGNLLENIRDPGIARVVAGEVGRRALGQKAGNVVSSALQSTVNPNIRAVFKSVRPREHSFSFKFLPRSQKEAQEIGKIVKWFRSELYPEPIKLNSLPVGYKFPNKFAIKMKYGNKDVATQLLPCYLQTMSTNYNSNTMSFYRDGEFTEIDLTLNMLEFRTLDKDDVEYGFNMYGKNYKDLWEEFFNDIRSAGAG